MGSGSGLNPGALGLTSQEMNFFTYKTGCTTYHPSPASSPSALLSKLKSGSISSQASSLTLDEGLDAFLGPI